MLSFSGLFLLTFVMLTFPIYHYSGDGMEKHRKEYVIVLHGVARGSSSMDEVAKGVESAGYEVYNLDYPSTDYSFEELRDYMHQKVMALKLDTDRKVHFVGYSMGSQMIRLYLQAHRPPNLGRVVMIAPPNHGSEAADFFRDDAVFQAIFGQAGQQLGVNGVAITLPDADYDLGIVAGNRSVDPVSSAVIPGADDGKVSVESTRLKGMRDHIILPVSHLFIITDEGAIGQVVYYLQKGRFKR